MHTYSVNNSSERDTIPFFIAALCIGIYYGIKETHFLPEWLPVPTTFALYGMARYFFDSTLWKANFLYDWGIIKTPNLNGKYKASFKSSIDKFQAEYHGTLTIEQNWTTINLSFAGAKANSRSIMCNINIVSKLEYDLDWEYLSEKKPELFKDGDSKHYGVTRLKHNSGSNDFIFEGAYFTEPTHDSFGSMNLVKVD